LAHPSDFRVFQPDAGASCFAPSCCVKTSLSFHKLPNRTLIALPRKIALFFRVNAHLYELMSRKLLLEQEREERARDWSEKQQAQPYA
jgi:hypothetical protein